MFQSLLGLTITPTHYDSMSTTNDIFPGLIEDLVGLPGTGRDGNLPIDCVPNDSDREQQDVGTPVVNAGEYTVRDRDVFAPPTP